MDGHFRRIRSSHTLANQSLQRLAESGFLIIPGPIEADSFSELTAAYDEAMAIASGPDFRIGSATTRRSDLLNYGAVFHDLYVYSPLLEASSHIIGEPFKLSSCLGRTLRPGSSSDQLHADLPRGSEDAPMVGFILMIDPFREDNGATRYVPTSHNWPDLPSDRLSDPQAKYPVEVLACGEAGTMIIFNAAIWHGHGPTIV